MRGFGRLRRRGGACGRPVKGMPTLRPFTPVFDGLRSAATNRASIGAALIALTAALALGGCSGSQIADHLPNAMGGLPADAPERPAAEQAYPAVHNMPPTRTTTTLSDEQQKRLQDDLVAVRNRYGTSPSPDAPAATGSTGNASAGSPAKP
jgi:hypothetical protein